MTTTQPIAGASLIDGRHVASSRETFRSTNPRTGQRIEPAFHPATDAEIDAAFAAAQRALEATRDLPREGWAQLLDTIAERIMALGDALLTTGEAETALPQARLTAERARTCGQLKLFAQLVREGSWADAVIDTADPSRQPLPKPDIRRVLRPIGPVVVFDASNFPFAFGPCGGDTASALAASNPVLVKAHTAHPATDALFAQAVLEALRQLDLPTGLFALLHGSGTVVGSAMVRHPLAQAVGFTGSRAGGRALYDLAAARPRPIPVYAEMGSLNPLIVLPAALREQGDAIADGLAGSVTLGAGQFCTKPGWIFVLEGPDVEPFITRLGEKLAAAAGFTLLNASIQQGFGEAVAKWGQAPGVTVRVAGACTPPTGCTSSLFEVSAATWRDHADLREEAFGPATLVIRCPNDRELIECLRAGEGNLTGTIHAGGGEDAALVRRVADALEPLVGRLIYNGYPTGVEVCHAMVHGGPYPATTAPLTTSVGTLAIRRFARPVAYQNAPDALLPPALRDANPLAIWRTVNGELTRSVVARK